MAAKRICQQFVSVSADESGQSVVEFVIIFPIFIGLFIVLTQVNMAIQVSINNQQYLIYLRPIHGILLTRFY